MSRAQPWSVGTKNTDFFNFVNLGPSRKIVGQIRGVFGFCIGYLGPLETSTPSPWPNPRYVRAWSSLFYSLANVTWGTDTWKLVQ